MEPMHIIDNEQRRFVDQDFDTHKEAVARLAELIEETRVPRGVLRIVSHGEPLPKAGRNCG
jgi:hypothetical protein